MPHEGVPTKRQPSESKWRCSSRLHGCEEIGRWVSASQLCERRVIVAVEAVEGRMRRSKRRRPREAGCVVVKVSKPQQDLRFDVPAIGVQTIRTMHDCGAAVLAVEADRTIFLEQKELLSEAERLGIAVLAVKC